MSSGCRSSGWHRWAFGPRATDCGLLTIKLVLDDKLDEGARPKGRRSARLARTFIELTLAGDK